MSDRFKSRMALAYKIEWQESIARRIAARFAEKVREEFTYQLESGMHLGTRVKLADEKASDTAGFREDSPALLVRSADGVLYALEVEVTGYPVAEPGVPDGAVIDGSPADLALCDWVLLRACGCPAGVTLASIGDDVTATEEVAWRRFYDRRREIEAAQQRGERVELMTHVRYAAEVSPLMMQHCPHRDEEGPLTMSTETQAVAGDALAKGCCGEPDCSRRYPISLYVGDFSDRVFAVTKRRVVSERGDGTATFAATERHDVTAQLREFVRRHPGFVRAILAEESAP